MSEPLAIALTHALPEGYADWLKQLKTDIARIQHCTGGDLGSRLLPK